MSGGLYLGGGIGVLEFANLIHDLGKSALFSGIKTFMDLAVAVRERGVWRLGSAKVGDPV